MLSYLICIIWLAGFFFAAVFLTERKFLYPLSEFKDEIISFAGKYDIETALVFAIVRTESGFKPDAVSEKGAKGLMQMTEKTASYVADLKGEREYDIINPKTNLDFGCYYYKYLEKKFENRDVCLAAYNAGEGKVNIWLKDNRYSTDGKTLISIPLKETRDYVLKVNKSLIKYKKLYPNIVDKS